VLATIAVTAALGLYAVAVPHFGELQAKVLATSASVSAASILVLACLPAWERRRLRPLPLIGAVSSPAAFALIVVGLWAEIEADWFWQSMRTFLAGGLFAALSSLLALARLAPRYRRVLAIAVGLALVLTSLYIAGIWSRPESEAYTRVVAAASVVTAAFVVAVPVLHRASRHEPAGAGSEARLRFCPSCGRRLPEEPGQEGSCPACGASFRVRFGPLP